LELVPSTTALLALGLFQAALQLTLTLSRRILDRARAILGAHHVIEHCARLTIGRGPGHRLGSVL
jgi:hypothetical protein